MLKKILITISLWLLNIPYAYAQQTDPFEYTRELTTLGDEETQGIINSIGGAGSSGFSTAKIIAWLIFGGVGFIALSYGKKQGGLKPFLIGLSLMAYPYFVTNTLLLYAIGAALCALLYFWRD